MNKQQLFENIKRKKSFLCVGLDTDIKKIPEHLLKEEDPIFAFNKAIIDATADLCIAYKPNLAFYESMGVKGWIAFEKTVNYIKQNYPDQFIIADAKRGDIGSTAEGYSEAYLGSVTIGETEVEPFGCDCLTINAYLGSDGINPFIKDCVARDRAVFALVKTSNPSSGELQNIVAGDRKVYNVVGDLLERLSKDTVDKYGYTCVGAVTGATYPMDIRDLRRRLEKTFFLVPGYGAQGGKAEDVQYAFDEYGHGAIVNSSRGIICAWQKTGKEGKDFGEAARDAAIAMREDLKKYITVV